MSRRFKGIKYIKEFLNKNIVLAIVINIVFLAFAGLFCEIKYEVSDDYIMDAVLSGGFGNSYNPYLLFSNVIYGFLLKPLYLLFPHVSWYFVFQLLICFLSLSVITYVILKRNKRIVGVAISILFVTFFSDDLYLLMQFTKTATVAVCAGGVCFLHGAWQNKRKVSCMVIGSILAIVGSMIRFSCIYISLVFLLLSFVSYVIEQRKDKLIIKKIVQNVLLCGCLIIVAFALKYADTIIRNTDDKYSSYLAFNTSRVSVTDSANYGYESVANNLLSVNLDENDYWMIRSWNILDQDIYTKDVLEEVAGSKDFYHIQNETSFEKLYEKLEDRGYQHYTVVFGLFIIILVILFIYPNKLINAFVGLIFTILLLFYFFYVGRVVYRVEYSIFFCFATYLVLLFKIEDITQQQKTSIFLMIIMLVLFKIPLYTPDKETEKMTDEEYRHHVYMVMNDSWNFGVEKYKITIRDRAPEGELLKYIDENENNFYMLDFTTTIQRLYLNYSPWERISEDVWDNCYYLGSVTYGHPDNQWYWAQKGIDPNNPNKCLVNENVYVVDNKYYDTKLEYLKKYYYPNARKELIAEIDGLYVWKYYSE